MITIHILKQAAELLCQHADASVPMIQRSLGIDYDTAEEVLDALLQMGVVEEDDVYRKIEVSEDTKFKLQVFLKQKHPDEQDAFFDKAVKTVLKYDRASASLIQRELDIGYARAARIIDQIEGAGLISPSDGTSNPRVVHKDKIEEYYRKNELN